MLKVEERTYRVRTHTLSKEPDLLMWHWASGRKQWRIDHLYLRGVAVRISMLVGGRDGDESMNEITGGWHFPSTECNNAYDGEGGVK